jgi:predicted ATPase
MRKLPSGTVTFLFTDVEGSTKLLRQLGPAEYAEALAEHRRIMRESFRAQGGVEVDTQGDAFFVAFPSAPSALAAAAEAKKGLASGRIRVRMGIHTGTPHLGAEGYVGEDVHLGARIAAAGHGGQILISRETRGLVSVELTDLGEHRLKDFAEPVWIFQLGSEAFPPLKTISNTNLPRLASSFVGREREVAEVVDLFKDGARLVTLSGPGGSGKTRLAIEAASELLPNFKNGTFWVGLAALRDPALVAETIAQMIGAKDGLAEHIGERELLLLADNLEQVIEVAPELATLLERCPNLRVLVTSREILRVRGEVEYAVPPLALSEAVELFCRRSQLRPDKTIAELCERLDSLPLAVELAAARTSVLSPIQIIERLPSRLDLLKGGRDAETRQQTLRATIEWSHDLLDGEEKTLFARLAVFAGGCTLGAAAEVARADLDTLQSLVDKSLVRHSQERFWMLETIREYAGESLTASGEADELRRRHGEHYLALAEEAAPNIRWYSAEWIERLEREHDNLRAALEQFHASGDGERVQRLAGALGDFWMQGGHVAEARRRLKSALDADGHQTVTRANVLSRLAEIVYRSGDPATSKELDEEALKLYRGFGDKRGIAVSLWGVGMAFIEQGDFEHARRALEESAEILRQLGDSRDVAGITRTLAFAYHSHRDYEHARTLHEANLREIRALGLKEMEAGTLGSLAMIAFEEGRADHALSLGNESLLAWRDVGSPHGVAQALCHTAQLAILLGKFDAAARLLAWFEAQRDQIGVSEAWVTKMNDQTLSTIRTQLDEAAFVEAWEQGRTLTVDDAFALALDTLERSARP